MKISKGLAQALLELYSVGQDTTDWEDGWFEGSDRVEFSLVSSELIDTSRWHHIHEVVYKDLTTGKFWSSTYRTGATECQDEAPYEYDGDVIDLTEVVPVEHTVIKYEGVK